MIYAQNNNKYIVGYLPDWSYGYYKDNNAHTYTEAFTNKDGDTFLYFIFDWTSFTEEGSDVNLLNNGGFNVTNTRQ